MNVFREKKRRYQKRKREREKREIYMYSVKFICNLNSARAQINETLEIIAVALESRHELLDGRHATHLLKSTSDRVDERPNEMRVDHLGDGEHARHRVQELTSTRAHLALSRLATRLGRKQTRRLHKLASRNLS